MDARNFFGMLTAAPLKVALLWVAPQRAH